jgi:hypothetical protein
MLTASEDFKAALQYSHRALTRAVLLAPGTTSGFVEQPPMTLASGSLRLDGTRNIWRSGNITVAPADSYDRATLGDIDSTFRIRLERGIRYPNGSEEWVVIGLFQVQEVRPQLSAGTVPITISDLGSLVEDFPLPITYVPQDAQNVWMTTVNAIKDLVKLAIVWDTIPGWDIDPGIDQAVKPVTSTVFTGSRWSAIQALADSIHAVVYPQPNGRWRIRDTRANLDQPQLFMESGREGTIVDLTRSNDRREQYNAIPLRWESPSIGGLVFIVDSDSTSPSFWNGPFGRKPRDEENNDLIVGEGQAIDAARALLDQYRGRTSSLSFTAIHNPLLEPLDVVQVTTGLGSEIHVIDSIQYPLDGGTMTCQTRILRTVVKDAVL